MRTAVSSLSLRRPRSLAQALVMMREEGPLTPLAGCTDVYVNLQFGTARETRFIDLWPLEELRGIADVKARATGERLLRIGALNTYSEIIASPLVRKRLPVLAAAEATVVLASVDDERRVPITSFYTGYRKSVRREDELIVAIDVPKIEGKQWWRKVGTRRAQAISKVMMAGIRGVNVRLAVGSVAPTVVR